MSEGGATLGTAGWSTRRRLAYYGGIALICAGVGDHVKIYLDAAPMDYMLYGMMGVGLEMTLAMLAIVLGLGAAGWALVADAERPDPAAAPPPRMESRQFGRAHRVLLVVSILAIAIDVMKPATLGFILPGMREEYGISKGASALLPLIALTGTAVGSIAWGSLADRIGRQPSITLAGLLFIGTSICGAMPTYAWNLAMCWLMGAAAGGLLPVMLTLVTETTPRRLRGLVIVLVAGVGGTAGFLAASGLSALLIPEFGWRIMWLIGIVTGLALIALRPFMPESYRFLRLKGRYREAALVARRFDLRPVSSPGGGAKPEPRPAPAPRRTAALLDHGYRRLTAGLIVYATSWGLVNYGFFSWLPTLLENEPGMAVDTHAITELIAAAALVALPGAVLVAVLYHLWSPTRTLIAAASLSLAGLVGVGVLTRVGDSSAAVVISLVVLIVWVNGMNALVLPYAAEVFPTELRGRGAGLIASAGKVGGVLGTLVVSLIAALDAGVTVAALTLVAPLLIGIALIASAGIDTRGRDLQDQVGGGLGLDRPVAEAP